LFVFALCFQLVEALLLAPAMGLLGRALEGRAVVDSTAILAFFLQHAVCSFWFWGERLP